MANPEHLAVLAKGVAVWNEWRIHNCRLWPDLEEANLLGANLAGADLAAPRYYGPSFGAHIDPGTDEFKKWKGDRVLYELGMHPHPGARLYHADLTGANLEAARLSGADMTWAHLSRANLARASLRKSCLWFAEFVECNLQKAIFDQAIIGWTKFGNTDLSEAIGLDTVLHVGPSTVGFDVLYRSRGRVSESFLEGVGAPDGIIEFQRTIKADAGFYSCFISYSTRDHNFADQVHFSLQSSGVRCWFAPEDLKIGDPFRQRIDDSIRLHDKLLLILSEHSVQSPWVEGEVEAALERERRENRLVLVPIRIDDAVMMTDQAWAASIRRTRHIGDFSNWKDRDSYQAAFQRLLRDLKAETHR